MGTIVRVAAILVCAVMAGCTSSQPTRGVPQPVPTMVASPAAVAAVAASTDVSVDAAVADARPIDAAPADAEVAEVADEPSGVTYEDGVRVVETDTPAWCPTTGERKGYCWRAKIDCQKVEKKCAPAKSFACLGIRFRTNGELGMPCAESYGKCVELADFMRSNMEIVVVAECAILRVREAK